MRQFGLYFKYFLFWLFAFFLQRTVFIAFNYEQLSGTGLSGILKSCLYGLWIDASAASYILILLIIVFFAVALFRKDKAGNGAKPVLFLSLAFIFISSLLVVIDVGLVSAWGVKINAKAISYIFYPALVYSVIGSVNYIALIAALIVMSGFLIYAYRYLFNGLVFDFNKKSFFLSVLLIPFLIVGTRGGVHKFPIGKNTVFVSNNFTLNYASLNSMWNFMDVLINLDRFSDGMYKYYSEEELNKLSGSFVTENNRNTTSLILTGKNVNIVLIIVESFGADNIQKLGGQNVAPKMNSLFDSSLTFTNFYANGFRTEHGLVALLSGFPPFPKYALLRETDKIPYLPNLANILKDSLAYDSRFYFTSSLEYAHTDEYLHHGGFSRVFSDNDFKNYRRHKSGAYDEDLFDFILKDKANAKQPFFSVVLTSTTHTPWDANVNKVFREKTRFDKYKNAIHYADSCIYDFIMKAGNEEWGKKTLFVITGDHTVGINKEIYEPVRYKLPLIFYGNILKSEYRGKTIAYPVSQLDFPKTILNQLGVKTDRFHIGNDMLDGNREHFAFYTYDNGIGVISKERELSFSLDTKTAVYSQPDSLYSRELAIGKAFLQTTYNVFAKLNLKAVK